MSPNWLRWTIPASLAALMTGCGTMPSPTEAVPKPNFQIRLSELHGAVEGGAGGLTLPVSGDLRGDACVLSVVGKPAPEVKASLAQGQCTATIGLDSWSQ